jgi:glutamine amidotransferase
MNIVIIDYGAGNVKSVQFALERLGYQAVCSNDPVKISAADKVIFPGVGEASSAMREIKKYGLDQLIPKLSQPVLGICLGMQLMCEHSEENDTVCLGIFPLTVKKFQTALKVPHMGWNRISQLKEPLFRGIDEESYVYFVHSYFVPLSPFVIGRTHYELDYAAAMQKGNFFACQFHPEKSGDVGEQLLRNFINEV